MKRFAILVIALLVCGSSSISSLPSNYRGEDAGYVVIALGVDNKPFWYRHHLNFRTRDASAGSYFAFAQGIMWPLSDKPDFRDASGSGIVIVRSLPPGDYDIYNSEVSVGGYNVGFILSDKSDAKTISFRINANRATYVGDFKVVVRPAPAVALPPGALFTIPTTLYVVTDKNLRDIPIAVRKLPPNIGIDIAVPEIGALGSTLFTAEVPEQN